MLKPTCTASRLYLRTRGAVAFNLTAEERDAIVRNTANGSGTSYTFRDGSRAFVPHGQAQVIVRRTEGGRPI